MSSGLIYAETVRAEQLQLTVYSGSDPANAKGQDNWVRDDIAPDSDQLATWRWDVGEDEPLDIPIYDVNGSFGADISKALHVPEINGSEGFIPLTTNSPATPQVGVIDDTGTRWGTDGLTAIPDSLEHQFVASSWSGSNGWTSEDGELTLSVQDSPTKQSDALNGEDTISFDGSNDGFSNTNYSISQTFGIVAVYQYQTTGQSFSRAIADGSGTRLDPDGSNGDFSIAAGTEVAGSDTDTNWHIHSGLFNGTDSQTRLDGSTETSGDAGTSGMSALRIANTGSDFTDIEFAEFWTLQNPSVQDLEDAESVLNDKYSVY